MRRRDRGEAYDGVKKKEPRFPKAPRVMRRKPWAVWLLLSGGEAWNYDCHAGIVEAWATARTLAGNERRVWIAHVDQPAHVTRKGANGVMND